MDKFKIFQLDGPRYLESTSFVPAIRTFPGGEQWVKLPPFHSDVRHVRLEAILLSSADVMTLIMLVDALRRQNVRDIRLTMPYVPYARQDRVCNEGESLSIVVFANIINSLEFESVVVYDAHSDVTAAVIERCIVKNRSECMAEHAGVRDLLVRHDNVWLVSPDAGAVKKSYDTVKALGSSCFRGIIFAEKVRDVTNGKILKTTVSVPHEYQAGDHLLVADDICDGGRTFIELAKALQPFNPGSMNLYVTHGIFSQGLEVLLNKKSEPEFEIGCYVVGHTGLFDNVWSTINFKDYV